MMLAQGDRWGLRGLGALLISTTLATACGDDKNMTATETNGASTGGTTGTATETPTTSGSTGAPDTSTTSITGTTDTTTTGTTEAVTSGSTGPMLKMDAPPGECLPKVQDCAEGQKCTSQEGNPNSPPGWDTNVCVPDPMNGGVVGDECQIDEGESVFSGLDNCAKGGICLNFDFNTGTGGTCTEYCKPDGTCPETAGGKAICVEGANEGVLPICLATCDPLIQDCPDGQGCYGDVSLDGFICFTPDTGENTGTDKSPCEFTNACAPGFSCEATDIVSDCDPGSIGCCTPFCSVMEGDGPCGAMQKCLPFYPMDPPPGLEDIGVCAIPQ